MFGPHRPGDKRYLGPETAPSSRFQARTSDDRGQPLRCTKLMSRPAEAAAKGVKGKLPDGVMQWQDELMRERDAFLAKNRKYST
jgi:hypothetical protein